MVDLALGRGQGEPTARGTLATSGSDTHVRLGDFNNIAGPICDVVSRVAHTVACVVAVLNPRCVQLRTVIAVVSYDDCTTIDVSRDTAVVRRARPW